MIRSDERGQRCGVGDLRRPPTPASDVGSDRRNRSHTGPPARHRSLAETWRPHRCARGIGVLRGRLERFLKIFSRRTTVGLAVAALAAGCASLDAVPPTTVPGPDLFERLTTDTPPPAIDVVPVWACAVPLTTTVAIVVSVHTCQFTVWMPGWSGVTRVQRITRSLLGSPEATPW